MKSCPHFNASIFRAPTPSPSRPAAPLSFSLSLQNCKLSTRWLTFGRQQWPRVKTLLNFQLSRLRHQRRPSNNCHAQENTINIYTLLSSYVCMFVCVCIYLLFFNKPNQAREAAHTKAAVADSFCHPGQGWPGPSIHFIQSY